MRSLIAVTILCLTSTSALACVVDTDCESGTMCLDGVCTHGLSSDIGDGNARPKRATGKTCGYDGDCSPASRCIKGSGTEGVCIGH